jgi:TonB family protein
MTAAEPLPQTLPRVAAAGLGLRVARRQEDLLFWAVLLAWSGSMLAIGVLGWQPAVELQWRGLEVQSAELEGGSGGEPAMQEVALESEATEVQAQSEVALEVPQPPPLQVEAMVQESLPPLPEVVDVADLFVVPAAASIETALEPLQPPAPKPKPAASKAMKAASTRLPAGKPGAGMGQGGAGGGSGNGGAGGFSVPKPAYPSSFRSQGIEGTVVLRIEVAPSGRASAVEIISSSGHGVLDQYALGWVRRNGRAPAGEARTFDLPLSFTLR